MKRPTGLKARLVCTVVLFGSLGAAWALNAHDLQDSEARSVTSKGVEAYKAGDFEAAVGFFKQALEIDPTNTNVRIYLGTSYASMFVPGSPSEESKRNGQAAIEEFERVLESDPGNVTALTFLASLYYGLSGAASTGNQWRVFVDKSKSFRQRLTEIEPKDPEHYYSIGVLDWTIAYRTRMELMEQLGLDEDTYEPLPELDRQEVAAQVEAIVDEGITALEKALELKADYLDVIAYLNLMYREKSCLVESPRDRNDWVAKADKMFDRYQQLVDQLRRNPPRETPQ